MGINRGSPAREAALDVSDPPLLQRRAAHTTHALSRRLRAKGAARQRAGGMGRGVGEGGGGERGGGENQREKSPRAAMRSSVCVASCDKTPRRHTTNTSCVCVRASVCAATRVCARGSSRRTLAQIVPTTPAARAHTHESKTEAQHLTHAQGREPRRRRPCTRPRSRRRAG